MSEEEKTLEQEEVKKEVKEDKPKDDVSNAPEESVEKAKGENDEEVQERSDEDIEEPVIEPIEDEEEVKKKKKPDKMFGQTVEFDKESWKPKTDLGKRVKAGEITSIDEVLDKGLHIREAEIVDALVPNLETDLLLVGQSKGKFGGGQRRVFRQTQKKTPEGNKPKFGTYAIVGNHDGFVGIGYGKAKETVPAREKAFRNARLNIMKIRRGCGSWQCNCKTPHSIPFAVEGKVSSVKIRIMPAPKGAGLVIEKECQRILEMAGVKDVYSLVLGQSRTKINLINACMNALKKLMATKINPKYAEELGVAEGAINKGE